MEVEEDMDLTGAGVVVVFVVIIVVTVVVVVVPMVDEAGMSMKFGRCCFNLSSL